MTCALAHLADGLSGSFSDISDGLARTLTDLVDGVAGALADLGQGFLRTLADLLDGLSGLADHVTRAGAHVLESLAEALDELRISVDRREDPIDNRAHVVEADLEKRLGFHTLDVDLELPELHVHTDVQLDEVEYLGLDRDMRFEVRKLEVDLVHLHHRDIEQDVRILARLGQRRGGVIPVLPLGNRRAALDVLGEPVLLSLL